MNYYYYFFYYYYYFLYINIYIYIFFSFFKIWYYPNIEFKLYKKKKQEKQKKKKKKKNKKNKKKKTRKTIVHVLNNILKYNAIYSFLFLIIYLYYTKISKKNSLNMSIKRLIILIIEFIFITYQ